MRTIVDFFIIGAGINVMRVNVTGATGAGAVLASREKLWSAVRRTNANPEEDHGKRSTPNGIQIEYLSSSCKPE